MRPSRSLALMAAALAPVVGCDAPKSGTPAKPKIEARKAFGQEYTQNVLKLEDALANGGVLADMTVGVTDPLSQAADVNRTLRGKIGGMAIQQAIQLRNAQSIMDPKPMTYDEFMAEIIKPGQPDGNKLPTLPYYQEYAWDEAKQEVVVVEFPAKKKEFEAQKPY